MIQIMIIIYHCMYYFLVRNATDIVLGIGDSWEMQYCMQY